MNHWWLFLYVWAVFVLIASGLSAPIVVFFWKRVNLTAVDLLALIAPFATWLSLMARYSEGRKSLANLAEPWIIALAVPVTFLIRVAIGRRFSGEVCSWLSVVLLSLVAVAVFWCTPAWPE
jgi:hypothetical protein